MSAGHTLSHAPTAPPPWYSASLSKRPPRNPSSHTHASTRPPPPPPILGRKTKKPSDRELQNRARAHAAQFLILFNAYGIPLSSGPYLEFYFTTRHPTTGLVPLALIAAAQLLFLFPAWLACGYVCGRLGFKWAAFLSAAVATGCQVAVGLVETWWAVFLVQGPVLGTALGMAYWIGVLCLSSHYQNNVPLMSMGGVAGGLVGALVYTGLMYQFLRIERFEWACFINAAITGVSLVLALGLVRRCKLYDLDLVWPNWGAIRKEKGTVWFVGGYFFVFFGLFACPVFLVLLVSNALMWPDEGARMLMTAFGLGAFSAAFSAHESTLRSHIGPVNTLVLSSSYAALSYVLLAWVPGSGWVYAGTAVYGMALGSILTLHIKAGSIFHWSDQVYHDDMITRSHFLTCVASFAASLGIVTIAILVEATEGFQIPFTVAGGSLFLGSIFFCIARKQRCGYIKFWHEAI